MFSNFDNEEKVVMVRFTLAPPFKASRNLWNDLIVMLAGQFLYVECVQKDTLFENGAERGAYIYVDEAEM